MMLGKLQRAHHTLGGYSAPAYLGGSKRLRVYLFFINGICILYRESLENTLQLGGKSLVL